MKVLICVLVLCFGLAKGEIGRNCLDCICEVESNCACAPCGMDSGTLSCGPYQIKDPYHTDCRGYDPGVHADWKTCTTGSNSDACTDYNAAIQCSEQCVQAYMDRYGYYCTGSNNPTCEDYARIHNGGPNGCNNPATDVYWERVEACCERVGGCP